MARDRKSFFERLTGSVHVEDDFYDAEPPAERPIPGKKRGVPAHADEEASWTPIPEDSAEAQLTVDVYQTAEDIFIKTIVAGVKPEDLDISVSRDSVTIKGRREETRSVSQDDYVCKELYWGSFARTVELPSEIDVDAAEAVEKHGLLILKLPKVNKGRQAKVRVKSI